MGEVGRFRGWGGWWVDGPCAHGRRAAAPALCASHPAAATDAALSQKAGAGCLAPAIWSGHSPYLLYSSSGLSLQPKPRQSRACRGHGEAGASSGSAGVDAGGAASAAACGRQRRLLPCYSGDRQPHSCQARASRQRGGAHVDAAVLCKLRHVVAPAGREWRARRQACHAGSRLADPPRADAAGSRFP